MFRAAVYARIGRSFLLLLSLFVFLAGFGFLSGLGATVFGLLGGKKIFVICVSMSGG